MNASNKFLASTDAIHDEEERVLVSAMCTVSRKSDFESCLNFYLLFVLAIRKREQPYISPICLRNGLESHGGNDLGTHFIASALGSIQPNH